MENKPVYSEDYTKSNEITCCCCKKKNKKYLFRFFPLGIENSFGYIYCKESYDCFLGVYEKKKLFINDFFEKNNINKIKHLKFSRIKLLKKRKRSIVKKNLFFSETIEIHDYYILQYNWYINIEKMYSKWLITQRYPITDIYLYNFKGKSLIVNINTILKFNPIKENNTPVIEKTNKTVVELLLENLNGEYGNENEQRIQFYNK